MTECRKDGIPMKKNVLIVEDNEAALVRLKQIIKEIDRKTQIHVVSSEAKAYQIALQYTIDVFLLDIILDVKAKGDVSGIEFAEKIRNIEKYTFTPIIFTTSLADPKLYAFTNIRSFAYLEKPYSEDEAKKVLTKALEYTTQRQKDKNLFFRKEGLLFSVNITEIVYIENYFHRLKIQTVDELLEMPYRSTKKIIEEIDSRDFVQCNRNILVNTKFISSVDLVNRYIVLKRGFGQMEIGKIYLKDVKEYLDLKEL